jgi:hypothetical protein
MNHKQALSDFRELRDIAGGTPYDSGEVLEGIGLKMLVMPNARAATIYLCNLIEMYCRRGGPRGDSLLHSKTARSIFLRHQLLDD